MSGLIPRADYDRLARRCEKLEEKLAWYEGEQREDQAAERVGAIKAALKVPKRVARLIICLESAAPHAAVRFSRLEECGPYTLGSAKVQMHRLRVRLANLGVPDGIETIWGTGYRLTPEARAFLRQAVPEAFPQPGGPTR